MMATVEQRNHAKSFLQKAEEYLASAEDNLTAERHTPAAGRCDPLGHQLQGRHRDRAHRLDGARPKTTRRLRRN
jgi:hypothetical protein